MEAQDLKSSLLRSSRQSKVSGQFGETLVAYLLSKNGFEVAHVDHTGLDILAYNKKSKRRLGISVKTRTRDPRGANSSVNFLLEDLTRLKAACWAFSAEPYVAAVVDRLVHVHHADISVWIVPLEKAKRLNTLGKNKLYFAVTEQIDEQYRGLADAFYARFT